MKIKSIILIFTFIFIVFSSIVYAGGGGIELQVQNRGVAGEKSVSVSAIIFDYIPGEGPESKFPKQGQPAKFGIWNSNSGQYCNTAQSVTDENGKIYGQCYSATEGQYELYVDLLNEGGPKDSHVVNIYFDPSTNQPTVAESPGSKPAQDGDSSDQTTQSDEELDTLKNDVKELKKEVQEQRSILNELKSILSNLLQSIRNIFSFNRNG